ncbi:MAG: hypothetical protein LBQ98_00480 [Nitrososphaerota archaeon]|nr:hypothetical protein [Nitrososphaerota archaeon]
MIMDIWIFKLKVFISLHGEDLMKFIEVVILLKEIADSCPGLDGNIITLIPQKAMYPAYQGYHINIKGNVAKECIGGLRKIVESHDLAMQIKVDCVVVYEARSI